MSYIDKTYKRWFVMLLSLGDDIEQKPRRKFNHRTCQKCSTQCVVWLSHCNKCGNLLATKKKPKLIPTSQNMKCGKKEHMKNKTLNIYITDTVSQNLQIGTATKNDIEVSTYSDTISNQQQYVQESSENPTSCCRVSNKNVTCGKCFMVWILMIVYVQIVEISW